MDSLISISALCITVSLFWLCELVMTLFVVLYGEGEMIDGGGAASQFCCSVEGLGCWDNGKVTRWWARCWSLALFCYLGVCENVQEFWFLKVPFQDTLMKF